MNTEPTISSLEQLEQRLNRQPFSPLFARLAEEYLNRGRIEDAKQLCTKGLLIYPNYSTAKLVYESCLKAESAALPAPPDQPLEPLPFTDDMVADEADVMPILDGEYKPDSPFSLSVPEAGNNQSETIELPPALTVPEPGTDSPIAGLESEYDAIAPPEAEGPADEEQPAPPGEEKAAVIRTDGPGDDLVERPKADEDPALGLEQSESEPAVEAVPDLMPIEPSGVGIYQHQEKAPEFENDVDRRNEDDKTVLGFEKFQEEAGRGERPIVSRTLAEIYASQGEYRDAIETYSLLISARPDRRTEFEDRISELEFELKKREQNSEKKPR